MVAGAGEDRGLLAVARSDRIGSLLFPIGRRLLQRRHDRGVAQRGDVAELAAVGDVAQQPAHDLPGPGFGRSAAQITRCGRANLPIRVPTCARSSSTRFGPGSRPPTTVT